MALLPTVPVLVVIAFVLAMAVTDVWKFKVQNVLTVPLLISGLIFHGVVEGSSGVLGSVLGYSSERIAALEAHKILYRK